MKSIVQSPFAFEQIINSLPAEKQTTLRSVKKTAESQLNNTPRFRFFTLHGSAHLDYLFEILHLLLEGGIQLSQEELFLLSFSICVHDLGMITALSREEIPVVLQGKAKADDPAALELFIRETHHELLDTFLSNHLQSFSDLGVAPAHLAMIRDISRCHRKVVLNEQHGLIRDLGALLRVIDELDISYKRAPIEVFLEIADDMDATSTWHWLKHNLIEDWSLKHNVHFTTVNDNKKIEFELIVHPTRENSIDYWLHQAIRPIQKALIDDEAQKIIQNRYRVEIKVKKSHHGSSVVFNNPKLAALETRALSAGRKVVLVIDDESRKLSDLFVPVSDKYHVVFSMNAADAIEKLRAMETALVIVDMQIGSGGMWSLAETNDNKETGRHIITHIREHFPETKIGVLTGTRHPIRRSQLGDLAFFLTKPTDPDYLAYIVENAIH